MVRSTPKTLLWLFVINLGIVFGAGIYESRIISLVGQRTAGVAVPVER